MGEHFDLPIFCCIIYMEKKIRCLWYLNKIFQRTDWDVLLVENKDRLTRFGFNFIKTLLEQQGGFNEWFDLCNLFILHKDVCIKEKKDKFRINWLY